jgi:hypothetical protein
MSPVNDGRFSKGTAQAMMVKAPFRRAALPIPAMARPTMSMVEDVAAPQTSDPISKTAKKDRNEIFVLNLW